MVQNAPARHLKIVSEDRRQRRRDQRRNQILEAADALIAEHGLRGITMQRVADRLDCAVGTLYLYFPSKGALLAALEGRAIDTLRASFETVEPGWDTYLAESRLDPELVALVSLTAFGAHWASASVVFGDEFQLQRALLSEHVEFVAREDVLEVLPVLLRLLEHPARLITVATEVGLLDPGDPRERALLWISALNGVLLLDNLAPLDRHLFRSQHLARRLTEDLLCGWGAGRPEVEVADAHVQRLAASVRWRPRRQVRATTDRRRFARLAAMTPTPARPAAPVPGREVFARRRPVMPVALLGVTATMASIGLSLGIGSSAGVAAAQPTDALATMAAAAPPARSTDPAGAAGDPTGATGGTDDPAPPATGPNPASTPADPGADPASATPADSPAAEPAPAKADGPSPLGRPLPSKRQRLLDMSIAVGLLVTLVGGGGYWAWTSVRHGRRRPEVPVTPEGSSGAP